MTLPDEVADDQDDPDPLFRSMDGLRTHADLKMSAGTSPVIFDVMDHEPPEGRLTFRINGGTVSAFLSPDRCEELAEALLKGADILREGDDV